MKLGCVVMAAGNSLRFGADKLDREFDGKSVFRHALEALPACDIDHHASDLYIRVTPESQALLDRFQYRHMVTTFIDNIDHVRWYDLPFCYNPTLTEVQK